MITANYTKNKLATTFINTEYYTHTTNQNYIQIHNILSNAQSAKESKIETLNKYLENTLKLPINRYLTINKYNLPELMKNLKITKMKTINKFNDPDAKTFKINKFIPLDKIINYLNTNQVKFNHKMLQTNNI